MSAAKFTPGPWQVEARKGETLVCRADSAILARVGAAKEQRANARLIASAPDLLAELQNALQALEAHGFTQQAGKARAAIAKATGGAA